MFNVSFLLARNHAAVPWINDFDIHQYDDPEIELLKENIAFVEAIPSDQADFTHVQDMSEAYEDHYTKAVDIITDLVSMEGSSEDCYTLLNNVSRQTVMRTIYSLSLISLNTLPHTLMLAQLIPFACLT